MKGKQEYIIPGLEDVGTPGNRRMADTAKIAEVVERYRDGEGVIIKETGMPAVKSEVQLLDPDKVSRLVNLPTSMTWEE